TLFPYTTLFRSVAELADKDPIEFRLELLERAKKNPVGEQNDYDPGRYAGVLELVRNKAGWSKNSNNLHRGVSAYFCHNTYVAEVVDLRSEEHTSELQSRENLVCRLLLEKIK